MVRFFHVSVALFCLCLLTHCVSNGPRTVRLSSAQIQQKLNSKLATPITVLKVFQVQLSNALVALDPAGNRLHTLLDASVKGPLLAQPLDGKLDISGVLEYDASQQAVILNHASLDNIQLAGQAASMQPWVESLGKQLSKEWLQRLVLYQVKPEDLKHGNTTYMPGAFKLDAGGVSLTLQPQ